MTETLAHTGTPGGVGPEERRGLLRRLAQRRAGARRVLIVPPDITRLHSGAGEITEELWELLRDRAEVRVLPATGTHAPMSPGELRRMFGRVPLDAFVEHDWREGVRRLGTVPARRVRELSGGKVDYPIHAEVDRLLVEGDWDWIVSVGQVVPHEVIGMANHNKNIFVGTGGPDTINKTHFLGAVCDMERIMGRAGSPVRDVLDHAEREFAADLPLEYILTVRARDASGTLVTRGLFAGEGKEGFLRAARLSREVNVDLVEEPLRRVVVWLEPGEYKSTWLGNKAIYRTRMALADGGELIVLAPGLRAFGEDAEIDRLIRAHGYRGTERTLEAVASSEDLRANLSAAAHLIHGSSEGRFTITYAPGELSRSEIESVGYRWADLEELEARYDPRHRPGGVHRLADGEEFTFISNPALGLWALREKFVR